MGKCCCAPEITGAKNEILKSLNRPLPIVGQGLPQSSINFPVEEIARRVADLLNPKKSDFESTVLRELAAIIQALTALKGRESDRELLLLVARNVSDLLTFTGKNHREVVVSLDAKATSAQARDLLFAITDSRRVLVDKLSFLSGAVAIGFSALTAGLAALAVLLTASKVALLAALAAATARILAAIAAIRIPRPDKVDLSKIEGNLRDLLSARLSLEPFSFPVPSCGVDALGAPAVVFTSKDSYAIKDRSNRSTQASTIAVSEMLSTLLIQGKLACTTASLVSTELILNVSAVDNQSTVFTALPSTLTAYWFVLEVLDVDEALIRTYKIAGTSSEYGAGNWAVIDSSGNACQSFTHIYSRLQRLDVPVRESAWGVRVSPKRGVSFRVTAFGKLFA